VLIVVRAKVAVLLAVAKMVPLEVDRGLTNRKKSPRRATSAARARRTSGIAPHVTM